MTKPPARNEPTDRSQASQQASRSVASSRETAKASDSVPLTSGPFATLPASFGRYQVVRLLGRGQMGSVYLAHDQELDRNVALKVARVSAGGSAKALERMKTEAKAAARIDDPLVCKVYDFGVTDGIRYIAQQYIPGEDLKSQMKRIGRKRSPADAITLLLNVTKGLRAAHRQGVIHRDLKPENILIRPDGIPVLMDFGLARLGTPDSDAQKTQAGMVLGTAAYMSVEQARGTPGEIDERSDLYALGVILFELLTGDWPFTGNAVIVMGQKCVSDAPSILSFDPGLPQILDRICSRLLQRSKDARFSDCDELLQALEKAQQELSCDSAPMSGPIHPGPPIIPESEPNRRRSKTWEPPLLLMSAIQRIPRRPLLMATACITLTLPVVMTVFPRSQSTAGKDDHVPAVPEVAASASNSEPQNRDDTKVAEIPKRPRIDAYFPMNSTYTGRYSGRPGIWCDTKSEVTSASGAVATLRFVNDRGPWDLKVEVADEEIRLLSIKYAGPASDKRNLLRNPEISGPADADARSGQIVLKGSWDVITPDTGRTEVVFVEFHFTREQARVDEIAAYFPLGSAYGGTWKGTVDSEFQDTNSTVTAITDQTATVRFVNDFGPWELRLEVIAGEIALRSIIRADGTPPETQVPLFRDIKVRGPANAEARNGNISLRGTWETIDLVANKVSTYYTEFHFFRDDGSSSPEIADCFPLGSTYTGRWRSEGPADWHNTTSTVTSIIGEVATVRFVNNYGPWELRFVAQDETIILRSISRADNKPAPLFRNVKIAGPMDEDARSGTIALKGTWDVTRPNAAPSNSFTEFHFQREH